MKSKPYQVYNNVKSYSRMNNQNPPSSVPPPPYSSGQTGFLPSYPPLPPNYSMQPNFVYPMYAEQMQPGYPNYWQTIQYPPQYPYSPMHSVQVPPITKPSSSVKSQKVTLNYNPPKKAQKPNIVYECKTCDKTFNGARQHETHMSLHKKCPKCDFEASKKVLNLHIEECHPKSINGNKNKFELNTPEEIEKWIAERKKNYPTDANIQRKKKELQEKIERGEVIPTGKRGSERPCENPRKKKQKRNNNNNNNNNSSNNNTNDNNSLGLISAYNSESDNEYNETSNNNENSESISTIINDTDKEKPQKNKKKDKSEIICKYYLHGHCSRGDKCQFKHERKNDNNKNKQNNNNQKDTKKKKSLLRMLLDKEIRNEKNKIFQCIRYIVNNNFFIESESVIQNEIINTDAEKLSTQHIINDININDDKSEGNNIEIINTDAEKLSTQHILIDTNINNDNDNFEGNDVEDISSSLESLSKSIDIKEYDIENISNTEQ